MLRKIPGSIQWHSPYQFCFGFLLCQIADKEKSAWSKEEKAQKKIDIQTELELLSDDPDQTLVIQSKFGSQVVSKYRWSVIRTRF